MLEFPTFSLLESPNWTDYELLDSGDGLKLERFGPYTFVRPEVQAMWSRAYPEKEWAKAHAVFEPTREESGGHWKFQKKVAEKWEMGYALPQTSLQLPSFSEKMGGEREGGLRFWAMTTPGRHLGVFPECATNWDWSVDLIAKANRPTKILNLFGYTGLGTLAAAVAGAQVTHVDASKKAVTWARENQALSGLTEKPVRWIVDDALKFVLREGRRAETGTMASCSTRPSSGAARKGKCGRCTSPCRICWQPAGRY